MCMPHIEWRLYVWYSCLCFINHTIGNIFSEVAIHSNSMPYVYYFVIFLNTLFVCVCERYVSLLIRDFFFSQMVVWNAMMLVLSNNREIFFFLNMIFVYVFYLSRFILLMCVVWSSSGELVCRVIKPLAQYIQVLIVFLCLVTWKGGVGPRVTKE